MGAEMRVDWPQRYAEGDWVKRDERMILTLSY